MDRVWTLVDDWHPRPRSILLTGESLLMAFKLDRDNGVPLYVQLREQISELIESRLWREGFKLPTERRLAEVLGVSRNTVSLAYNDLVDRGLIESHQGRGTFVRGDHSPVEDSQGDKQLDLLVESILDQVVNMGYDLSTIEGAFNRSIEARRSILARVRIAFVECNREQLDYFSNSLRLGAGIHVMPVLLSELLQGQEDVMECVASADLVVTTFFHLAEVRNALGPDDEVLGIALDPEMETMVRIAQLPRGSKVGLICLSENFAHRVMKSMWQSGLDYYDVRIEISPDTEAVQYAVEQVDALIVSPGRRREVTRIAGPDKAIIEFIYKPDAGSINALQSRLLDRTRKE